MPGIVTHPSSSRTPDTTGIDQRLPFSRIARYLDAIRNLPGFMMNYGGWDQRYFELTLGDPDSELGQRLHNAYKAALAQGRKESQGEQGGTSDGDKVPT